ncbi:MAG: internalin, putative, partial [uncultured Cytophagales bacterium]
VLRADDAGHVRLAERFGRGRGGRNGQEVLLQHQQHQLLRGAALHQPEAGRIQDVHPGKCRGPLRQRAAVCDRRSRLAQSQGAARKLQRHCAVADHRGRNAVPHQRGRGQVVRERQPVQGQLRGEQPARRQLRGDRGRQPGLPHLPGEDPHQQYAGGKGQSYAFDARRADRGHPDRRHPRRRRPLRGEPERYGLGPGEGHFHPVRHDDYRPGHRRLHCVRTRRQRLREGVPGGGQREHLPDSERVYAQQRRDQRYLLHPQPPDQHPRADREPLGQGGIRKQQLPERLERRRLPRRHLLLHRQHCRQGHVQRLGANLAL